MQQPQPGQRWVSDSEPELGLGVVKSCLDGMVQVAFRASAETRRYALASAPLRRVEFKPGDKILLQKGASLVVESVKLIDSLLHYSNGKRTVSETELSDAISFSKPEDRLLAGVVDEIETFQLRLEALYRRHRLQQSPVRGFVGGRIDLIPHQLYIASEVSRRLAPRVLLADEVGLGKTIEAGLILHRLHLTGRASRILILVPEPLVHQWFVEMLRRFNLLFSLFDEERCEGIQLHHEELNPFLENQLVICSVDFLAGQPERAAQAVEADWDVVVVDEAHHLEWSPEAASPQYEVVDSLAKATPGLLLLTATPQQLGPEGHFARLRLLDPDRYADLNQFREDAAHYEQLARAVDRLLAQQPLNKQDRALFASKSAHVHRLAAELTAGNETVRQELISALLDEFGTGRVMFRNTRAVLSGFPVRKAYLIPLPATEADPMELKAKWLAGLLRQLGDAKVLLICQTRELTAEIQSALQQEIQVNSALFHEGLTLLQRDRQAAYFAEEDGARILLCSEIGSEGRNFQFAHHLVLFDLPLNPELLEQRIGRLDRIGQTETIQLHVPFLPGTTSEVLAKWYHLGMGAFEHNVHGANEIAREIAPQLETAMAEPTNATALNSLIRETKSVAARIGKRLAKGHDRLLELNSCSQKPAETLIGKIRQVDEDLHFETFFIRLLDHFGMTIEERGPRTYVLHPGNLQTDAFPAMPAEGMTVTFDRPQALVREDWALLTWDHPLVRGALDLLLGNEQGNACFAVWPNSGADSLVLETCFVAQAIAPAALHVDRFLPATPIRIVVDHAKQDLSADRQLINAPLEPGELNPLLNHGPVKTTVIPQLLEEARRLAARKAAALAKAASTVMGKKLTTEIDRLESLRQRNDHVKTSEIDALHHQRTALHQAINQVKLRLDSVRLILRKR